MRIPKRGLGKSITLTTFRIYRFRRMPFSLKVALVFQTRRDHTFEGCKGVVGIADEIAVFGKINEEHDRNMHATALSRSFVPAPFA